MVSIRLVYKFRLPLLSYFLQAITDFLLLTEGKETHRYKFLKMLEVGMHPYSVLFNYLASKIGQAFFFHCI